MRSFSFERDGKLMGRDRPREMRKGKWYWAHKALIQEHAHDIRAIGIAVYSCLAAMANRDQECFPSQRYLASTLGYSRGTISKALKILQARGLIAVKKKERACCLYRLLSVGCKEMTRGVSTGGNRGVRKVSTNKNNITRINNNNIVGVDKLDDRRIDSHEGALQKTREELLAEDIATGLEDHLHLPRYLTLAKIYPEPFLRQILSEAKQIPASRIKKSRAALFYHLLKKHELQRNHHSGDQSRN